MSVLLADAAPSPELVSHGQAVCAGWGACPWLSSSCTPRGVKSHLFSLIPSSNSLPVQSCLFSLWSLPLPVAVGHPREHVCLTPPLQQHQQLPRLIFILFLYKEGPKSPDPSKATAASPQWGSCGACLVLEAHPWHGGLHCSPSLMVPSPSSHRCHVSQAFAAFAAH